MFNANNWASKLFKEGKGEKIHNSDKFAVKNNPSFKTNSLNKASFSADNEKRCIADNWSGGSLTFFSAFVLTRGF